MLTLKEIKQVVGVQLWEAPSALRLYGEESKACLFLKGKDGSLTATIVDSGNFIGTIPICDKGRIGSGGVAIVNTTIPQVFIFFQDVEYKGDLRYLMGDLGKFEEFVVPGAKMSRRPAPVMFNGQMYVFYEGADQNGRLKFVKYDSEK